MVGESTVLTVGRDIPGIGHVKKSRKYRPSYWYMEDQRQMLITGRLGTQKNNFSYTGFWKS